MKQNAELNLPDLRNPKDVAETNLREDYSRNGDGKHHEQPADEIWVNGNSSRSVQTASHHPRLLAAPADEEATPLPFDPIRLLDALKRKWFVCVVVGLLGGALGFSWFFLGARSYVAMDLVRREAPSLFKTEENGEGFTPQKYTDQALVNLLQSPEMVKRVAQKANPPIEPRDLARSLAIFPDRENELVHLVFNGKAPAPRAAQLINLFAEEAVTYSRELQTREARALVDFISEKLTAVNNEIASLDGQMKNMPMEARAVDKDKQVETYLAQLADLDTKYELAKIDYEATNPINDKLQIARDELAELLLKYTDEHPFVQRQREKIKALELQAEELKKNPNPQRMPDPARQPELKTQGVQVTSAVAQRNVFARQIEQIKTLRESVRKKLENLAAGDTSYVMLKNRYQSLEKIRTALAGRQREAEMFMEAAPGYLSVLTPATAERVNTKNHVKKAMIFTVFGAIFGMLATAGLILLVEVVDDRVKTVTDMERATDLPVLASVGDLDKMDAAAQRAWAFRTWTILKGKLDGCQTQGMVCGFISATPGEGRSRWIKLLSSSANERGLRVLAVTTRPSEEQRVHPHEPASPDTHEEMLKRETTAGEVDVKTLAPSVLASPGQVEQQLAETDPECPVVYVPLPGWVWNLERRKQWQNALAHWKQIDNLVLLVELPPACQPESILLAEKVPQLIWFAESGKVTMKQTKEHLETLRHAGCNLVGAVLNREPESFWRNQISRWFGLIAVALLSLTSAQAQQTNTAPVAVSTNATRSFSLGVTPENRAEWQKHLTLGPGDVINLGFFGDTNLTKNEVVVGPDGRISYLQATDVMATGLTVDELRQRIDQELSKYYRSPKSIVTPVSYHSKRYYVLGKVMTKGVFTLDRPITIVEAVARAKGLETALLGRNTLDMADLQRSFLIRQGQRIPIDFEKLFNEGDLSQNVPIEPDDYLYFPASNLREVYVVGAVRSPGVVTYTDATTLISAITERGGFSDRSFKSRVLVVRGSLNRPTTFVVDTHKIVDARGTDFKLQPKDIIYVADRPFIRVEELLDLAATGFIQSATTAWTGQFVGPFITKPFIHGIYNNR